MKPTQNSRRKFLTDFTLGFGGTVLLSSFSRCQSQVSPASSVSVNVKKSGVALVGLGGYSSGQLAPALQQTKNCYLAGVVTGTPAKEKLWAEKYNIPRKNIYNYQNFDTIRDNKDIDIVYVVLPVGMHKEFTIRAANAGKHVICEKPMAVNASDCQEMIDACKKASRLLSIGYRLHFEPFNMEAMRIGQQKVYGKIITINAENGFTWGNDKKSWRLNKALAGGGGLMDMGVYAIQAARYTTGEEPAYVTAREEKLRPDVFKEVDETIYFDLDFDSGTKAKCMSSYNKNISRLRADAERGWFEFSPAFYYGGQVGKTIDGPMNFDNNFFEQVAQMDDFAICVQENKTSKVSGEEGLKDMRVVDAIYKSISSDKREKIV
ncbi:MAG: Gfo/Idh/MocA family oxidoreductase [Bacteroidota bacterium]|nr:Gfo/Idh/MocA family oxidoreductase [Bacteroidota bacterium]